MGTMMVSEGSSSGGSESFASDTISPQGRLYVPPAYAQTSNASAVALTSANHKVALGFTPEIDLELDAVSFYVQAIGTTGDVSIDLYDNGSSLEPNGELNGSATDVAPTMTSNTTPSPYVVAAWDVDGDNAEAEGFEAYKCMNGNHNADDGFRSNSTPQSSTPIYISLDLGEGNAQTFNKMRLYAFNNSTTSTRAYPTTFTLWGSNVASPTYNTDTDWTQLQGNVTWSGLTDPGTPYASAYYECVFVNTTAYRHYRMKITARNGSNYYTAIGQLQWFAAQEESAPGSLVQSLGTKAIGSAEATWLRHSFTPYQLQRGVPYWLVFSGEASKDFSLAVRRNNTAAGSMFPDGCRTKQTSDGSVWAQSQQDARQAMLNVILNSTSNHCPQLVYGRWSGRHIPLYSLSGWTMAEIPEAGIKLDSEALSVSTMYHVYVYDNSGTLALEADRSKPALQDGVEVLPGDLSHRYLGAMGVDEVQSGYQGPVDTPDARLVRNRYNRIVKEFTKDPNYTAYTRADHYGNGFTKLNNNNDFMMRLVTLRDEVLVFTCSFYVNSSYGWIWGVALDSTSPHITHVFCPYTGSAVSGLVSLTFSLPVSRGFHSVWPVVSNLLATQTMQFYLCSQSSPYQKSVCLESAIPC